MKDADAAPASVNAPTRSHLDSGWTWIAVAIVVVCVPLIYMAMVLGGVERWVLYVAPPVSLVLWSGAMVVRLKFRRNRSHLGWFAFRDGIIAFGAPGLVFIYMGISSFEQKAERVARQMQEQADVAGIRAWAAEYKPDPNASRWDTLDGNEGFDVPQERWPEAIRRLQPNYVSFTTDSKCVHLVFGGGFGHWGLVVGPKGSAPCSGNTLLLEDRAWVRTLGDGTWFWVQR